MLRPFKVTWWDDPSSDFDLGNTPHWMDEETLINAGDNQLIPFYKFVAAVMATSPEQAALQILEAYEDDDPDVGELTVQTQPYGWSPFTEDTPQEDWMNWSQRPH